MCRSPPKVGPLSLPFGSPYYAFSLEVERLAGDHRPRAHSLACAAGGSSRAPLVDTLRVTLPPAAWPPTAGLVLEVMQASFPFAMGELEKHLPPREKRQEHTP